MPVEALAAVVEIARAMLIDSVAKVPLGVLSKVAQVPEKRDPQLPVEALPAEVVVAVESALVGVALAENRSTVPLGALTQQAAQEAEPLDDLLEKLELATYLDMEANLVVNAGAKVAVVETAELVPEVGGPSVGQLVAAVVEVVAIVLDLVQLRTGRGVVGPTMGRLIVRRLLTPTHSGA